MSRARSWCFTLNNHTFDDLQLLLSECDSDYLLFGFEIGENKVPHLQGYIQYKDNSVRMSQIKRYLPRAHLEVAKGDFSSNLKYCTKDGDFYEFGDRPRTGQGKRTDIEKMHEMVKSGSSYEDICEAHTSLVYRYEKNVCNVMAKYKKHRSSNNPPTVYWIYGPSGAGKTTYAESLADGKSIYFKDESSRWWDFYEQQYCVVIDDLSSGSPINYSYLRRLLDRFPLNVEAKGTVHKFNSPLIIVTSDRHPSELLHLEKDSNDEKQILRRITHLIDITTHYKISYK